MIAVDFSKSSIIDLFVSAGMLYAQTKSCADLYALTDLFKIDWSKVQGWKYWFIDIVPDIIAEVFMFGFISESFLTRIS